ncbi:hypothetical protein QR680_010218 [Steinernema hermaphroditum]|uniref:Uncharacterized protein n=1 Tax=Steinernema hermaphroditum TaxID=289476 RepID=A0AA39IQN3_9BILA|nr:hypothetical protein QR680_010218 [Steinernema hermaphroditum]
MDCLPFDLIDHLVHFLPLADVETITKAIHLAAWNEVAEDHLRERFILNVSVYLPCNDDSDQEESKDSNDSEYDEDEYDEDQDDQDDIPSKRPRLENEKKPAPFLMFVNKSLFNSRRPISHWNSRNWRYAWLKSVYFHSLQPYTSSPDENELYQPCELQDILRIISLPVAPISDTRSRSSLSLGWIRPTEMDSALNMLNVLQKTFTQTIFCNHGDGIDLKVEEFLSDYLDRETMGMPCSILSKKILSEAAMKTLLARWREGSGEFVVEQIRRTNIKMDRCTAKKFSATRRHTTYPVFFAHPVVNARLKIHRFNVSDHIFRISVVPIDTEVVDDWNFDKLFELR